MQGFTDWNLSKHNSSLSFIIEYLRERERQREGETEFVLMTYGHPYEQESFCDWSCALAQARVVSGWGSLVTIVTLVCLTSGQRIL